MALTTTHSQQELVLTGTDTAELKCIKQLNEKQISSILNRIPMNRIGLPKEICSSAIYLASSDSNYITGQTIHVNGGMLMS